MINFPFRKKNPNLPLNGLNKPQALRVGDSPGRRQPEYEFMQNFWSNKKRPLFTKVLFSKAPLIIELKEFFKEFFSYLGVILHLSFIRFETSKNIFVTVLYRQRGKNAKRFVHSGMAGLAFVGVMIAPVIAQEFPGTRVDPWEIETASSVLSTSVEEGGIETDFSDKPRGKIIEYSVSEGDTVSSIAQKFGVSTDTILWQNDIDEKDRIKPGQTIEILPVTGVSHKVAKGETVFSIAKKYDAPEQAIVDFPYNTFVNDETFELAIGQIILVPEGIKPVERAPTARPRIRQLTPDAGTVVASGAFVWPTSGQISQGFAWYHKGVDIANRSAPDILAADSGTVVVAGWPDNYGYGNRVIIDHGNGYKTLYGHLSKIYVVSGQTVSRGSAIGKMGSTGRSTGNHLHFEVVKNGTYISPLTVLR